MIGLLLALVLSVPAQEMILKAGADLVKRDGYRVAKVWVTDINVPTGQPLVKVPVELTPGHGYLVCLKSRQTTDTEEGGFTVQYGNVFVDRPTDGKKMRSRCTGLASEGATNKYLSVSPYGVAGRRDLYRRITIEPLT